MARTAHQRLAPPADAPIDIAGLPDLYAMRCVGDCMAPDLADGSTLLFDKLSPVREGDLIVIWKRPGLVKPGDPPGIIKRLHMDPFRVSYPCTPGPLDNIEPVIVVEMNNPPRRFTIACTNIAAVHRCLGPVSRMPDGTVCAARELIDVARRGE